MRPPLFKMIAYAFAGFLMVGGCAACSQKSSSDAGGGMTKPSSDQGLGGGASGSVAPSGS